ncbi:MAG: acylneuraminate cytidylyltransferase family protein [Alphaproteobacteria bacterium]|nr:acylneuraminate cytidylyltransferase family protein [Alphaproteobacteria bacterium]MBU2270046.1 acylneuraminate cytidylyltransferase family protein [Alphaproteobacteria bacterium]MBU2417889.1 acylneuraminate cytidylyltransferase family protein [Alphaproteobacteria bacterium]
MIAGRSVLAIITARGGSQGLPRKNVLPFRGRPLIAWTIAAARASGRIDRLVLSSDDPEIIAVAEGLGCEAPFRRAPALSGDAAASIDVVLDALDRVPGYDVVVLLQPTSPLRTAADIDGALDHMAAAGAPGCVSVQEAQNHPWLVFGQDGEGRLKPFASPPDGAGLRRQDLPPALVLNGAVYAADAAWLRREKAFVRPGETVAWEMPADRSIDIDTWEDFQAAERLANG